MASPCFAVRHDEEEEEEEEEGEEEDDGDERCGAAVRPDMVIASVGIWVYDFSL